MCSPARSSRPAVCWSPAVCPSCATRSPSSGPCARPGCRPLRRSCAGWPPPRLRSASPPWSLPAGSPPRVLGSCGCFGRPDTPATGAHLVLTAALAATAAAVALSPPATGWTGQAPAPTALLLGFAVLLAALAYLVLAVLPATTVAAVRGRPKG